MAVWKRIGELISEYPFSFSSDFFLVVGVIIGLITLGYLDRTLKIVFLFLALCLVIEAVLIYYAARTWNNYFLVNVMSLVVMLSYSVVYWREVASRYSRVTIVGLLILYLAVFAYSFEWVRVSEYLLAVERVILMIFVILHLQFILEAMRVPNLLRHPMFWVSSGIMIYAAGTFFIFMFAQVTFGNPQDMRYWMVVQAFTCLLYTMLMIAFYVCRREVRMKPTL